VRKGLLVTNPINRAEKIPSPGESDHGQVLDAEQLLQDFKGTALFPIVAVAINTGARRNEILALQWRDLDPVARTLRIERSVEETKAQRRLKGPKREKHKRTISIDDGLVRLLLSVRDQHLRLVAGIPNNADVDLSLIKLPEGALMFPSLHGQDIDLTRLRRAHTVTRCFEERARRRFPGLAFTICGGVMRPPCLMLECRCIRLPLVVVTTRQCFCEATPSGQRSPIRPLPTSSTGCRKQFWSSWVQIWVQFYFRSGRSLMKTNS
jgi:hypothetical protein